MDASASMSIMDILLKTHDSQTHSALGAAQNAAMHEGYRNQFTKCITLEVGSTLVALREMSDCILNWDMVETSRSWDNQMTGSKCPLF